MDVLKVQLLYIGLSIVHVLACGVEFYIPYLKQMY